MDHHDIRNSNIPYMHKSESRVNHEDSNSILSKSSGRSPLNFSLQPSVDEVPFLGYCSGISTIKVLSRHYSVDFPHWIILFNLLLTKLLFSYQPVILLRMDFLPFTCWAFPSKLVLFSLLLIRIAFLSDLLFPQPFVDFPKQFYALYHYSSTSLHYHPFGDNNLLSFILTLTLLVSVIFTTACSLSSFWW